MPFADSKDKTNVINPISISLILGGIFIVINIFVLFLFKQKNTLYNLVICFIFVFAFLYLFIFGIMYVLVLNGKNLIKALQIIAIIVSITLIMTAIIMYFNLDGKYVFINVFENSIGFFICSLFYRKSIDKIFQFKQDYKDFFENKIQFTQDKTVLLTLFTLENFDELYKLLNDKKDIDIFNFDITENVDGMKNDDLKEYLRTIVSYKNIIGILGWFYITAFFTTIISIKYLATV